MGIQNKAQGTQNCDPKGVYSMQQDVFVRKVYLVAEFGFPACLEVSSPVTAL